LFGINWNVIAKSTSYTSLTLFTITTSASKTACFFCASVALDGRVPAISARWIWYCENSPVVAYAKRFLGTRYVWGASRPGAFDCSGFTQYVMKHAKGRMIPRVSRRQAYYGRYVTRRNLRAGDLIFFDTSRRRRGYVNHVGIYIGNGKFIHASSGKHRVVITSLNKPFYRQRFMWGRRIN